jgi:tripartite-type tricarboxylate transporter receptor subunit TctC
MKEPRPMSKRRACLFHGYVLLIGCALAAALGLPAANAQSFPSRPVRFIVPFPPGGGTDGFARVLGAALAEIWGQQVIIDNRGGAQGNIGTAIGAKAPPDGYTLTLAHQGALVVNPHLYSKPGYDTLRDFAAVSRGTEMAFILVAHPSVPARSMKELAGLAKKNPGKLTFASTSAAPQLVGELFKLTTGTDMVHVPYKGAGPAVIDLLAGHVNIMFANPTSTVPHVKSGRLRALGVMDGKRNEALPDVPTAVEAGYPAMGNVIEWYGVIVPAATPRALVARINSGVVRALKSPDAARRIQAMGQGVSPSTPAEFASLIRAEYQRWGKVVRESGAKVE